MIAENLDLAKWYFCDFDFDKAIRVKSQIRVELKSLSKRDIGKSKKFEYVEKERNEVVEEKELLSVFYRNIKSRFVIW